MQNKEGYATQIQYQRNNHSHIIAACMYQSCTGMIRKLKHRPHAVEVGTLMFEIIVVTVVN